MQDSQSKSLGSGDVLVTSVGIYWLSLGSRDSSKTPVSRKTQSVLWACLETPSTTGFEVSFHEGFLLQYTHPHLSVGSCTPLASALLRCSCYILVSHMAHKTQRRCRFSALAPPTRFVGRSCPLRAKSVAICWFHRGLVACGVFSGESKSWVPSSRGSHDHRQSQRKGSRSLRWATSGCKGWI